MCGLLIILLIILCTACARKQTDVLEQQQLKRTQSGSSSWRERNRGAVQSDHVRLVLARDTTAQGTSE